MSWDAYVFGDLQWPMPDPGLLAVWRAMSLDPDRWDDWGNFGSAGTGTVGELLDSIATAKRTPGDIAPLEVVADENGVRLRAYLEKSQSYWWHPLATAWRLAAELGASGEFVWVPGEAGPTGIAYRGAISDGNSAWHELTGAAVASVENLPGRREIDDALQKGLADLGLDAAWAPSAGATAPSVAEELDDVFAGGLASLDSMFPSEDTVPVAIAEIDDALPPAKAKTKAKKPAAKKKPAKK